MRFQIERIGPQHQAGSDSLLTGSAFFKMREVRFVMEFIFHVTFRTLSKLYFEVRSLYCVLIIFRIGVNFANKSIKSI